MHVTADVTSLLILNGCLYTICFISLIQMHYNNFFVQENQVCVVRFKTDQNIKDWKQHGGWMTEMDLLGLARDN